MAESGNLSTTKTFMTNLLPRSPADPRRPIVAPSHSPRKADSGLRERTGRREGLLPVAESEEQDSDENGKGRDEQDENAEVQGAGGFGATGRGGVPADHAPLGKDPGGGDVAGRSSCSRRLSGKKKM